MHLYYTMQQDTTINRVSLITDTKLYTLRRDDLPPLRFRGIKLEECDTRTHDSTRWVEVRIYRTQGGRYILRVCHRTQWQGESDTLRAWSLSDPTEIRDYLRDDLGHIPDEVYYMLERLNDMPEFAGIWMEEVA